MAPAKDTDFLEAAAAAAAVGTAPAAPVAAALWRGVLELAAELPLLVERAASSLELAGRDCAVAEAAAERVGLPLLLARPLDLLTVIAGCAVPPEAPPAPADSTGVVGGNAAFGTKAAAAAAVAAEAPLAAAPPLPVEDA